MQPPSCCTPRIHPRSSWREQPSSTPVMGPPRLLPAARVDSPAARESVQARGLSRAACGAVARADAGAARLVISGISSSSSLLLLLRLLLLVVLVGNVAPSPVLERLEPSPFSSSFSSPAAVSGAQSPAWNYEEDNSGQGRRRRRGGGARPTAAFGAHEFHFFVAPPRVWNQHQYR